MKWRKIGAATAVVSVIAAPMPWAMAMEDTFVYMPGISVGVPTGALPPVGLYSTTQFQYFNLFPRNNSGQTYGVQLHDYNASQQFLVVPQFPQLFGASYGAFIVIPFRGLVVQTPVVADSGVGLENTVIAPLILSWNLRNDLHLSVGFTFYPDDGTWRKFDAVHVSRNYFSFEPNAAVSYLNSDWAITLHGLFDFSTRNQANGYLSGDTFTIDYTLQHKFGPFDVGLGGSFVDQFTNDMLYGVPIPTSPYNGYGNRGLLFNIGPAINYHFGQVTVTANVLFDVVAINSAGGVRSFFSVETPIWLPDPAAKAIASKY
jgi:hypothetical protein